MCIGHCTCGEQVKVSLRRVCCGTGRSSHPAPVYTIEDINVMHIVRPIIAPLYCSFTRSVVIIVYIHNEI